VGHDDRVSQPTPGRAVRNAHHPLAPLSALLAMLTGIIIGAGNDWWWPALLLIGLALASLAWTYYARHRWPEASDVRTGKNAAD
jgi:hypothetical protein